MCFEYKNLIGYRIRLKRFNFSSTAVKLYKNWFKDSYILKQMGYIGDTFNETDIERWKELQNIDSNQIMFNIVLNSTNQIIGMSSITVIHDKRKGDFEILIGFKEYRNQGLGTEAIKLMIKFCFVELKLNDVQLRVRKENTQAIRCYEKAGFSVLSDVNKHNMENGIINMKINKTDFIREETL